MNRQQLELILTPTDFIAVANQALEFTFRLAKIQGEIANFKISKKRWVYFDLKDDFAKVSCFTSVYNLPGPLEDGMVVLVSGQPRLHPQFGFSVNVQAIKPAGEGSIKKAYEMLKAKLQAEGLFELSRKRILPYPPQKVALITSIESAAYADFIKILNQRWPFIELKVRDVQVQGEAAPQQLIKAIERVNKQAQLPDVLVITRGGGSNDDLAAFNDERVVRAIAASRVSTLVAIGHEIDISLSELVADKRASTPSNAAELLVPDRKTELETLNHIKLRFKQNLNAVLKTETSLLKTLRQQLLNQVKNVWYLNSNEINSTKILLAAYSPNLALKRGYSITRLGGKVLKSTKEVKVNNQLNITLSDGQVDTKVQAVHTK